MTPGGVVELRDAGPEDVAAVAAAERALFGTEAWSTSVVVDALAGGTRTVVVAEVGNVLAGYAVVSVVGEVADLERIAVLPERRRAGLATALLDAVRTRAHLRGAQRLLLEVAEANEGARALYAAHGSVELDRRRRYYRDGSDALVLRLPVAATGSAREEGNGG